MSHEKAGATSTAHRLLRRMLVIGDKQGFARMVSEAVATGGRPSRVDAVSDPSRALERVRTWPGYDLVILGPGFSADDVVRFLDEARSHTLGSKAAYLTVADSNHQQSEEVATLMAAGIHGFISSPFDAAECVRAVDLALGVQQRGSRARLTAATTLYLSELFAGEDFEVRDGLS
ncbi:MAG: response regulator transcription factor, partial [Bdellovibrionales bacterium]|nr:response regulator transcription factor [Bdellovibrionales bacterium]